MASDTERGVIIGVIDGLTAPFSISAGLSGASVATKIIVTADLAEIAADSISTGLGGYFASQTGVEYRASVFIYYHDRLENAKTHKP